MSEQIKQETVQPKEERKPRGDKPQREQRAPKQDNAEGKPERPHQDSKEFLAMKAKQEANRLKIKAHIEELKKLNQTMYGLNDQRKGKFSGVAPELRTRMQELNKQDSVFKEEIKQLEERIEQLINESKAIQGDLPKGTRTTEHLRQLIDEKEYEVEHDNMAPQKEKEVKAEITKLQKVLVKLPAYEKIQAEIDECKAKKSALREQQKPIITEKRTLFEEIEKQQKEGQTKKLEREEIEVELKNIQQKRSEIEALIKELEAANEVVFQEFKQQQDVIRKQRDAERAQREVRDKMKPTIDKLYDVAPKVIEEPRFSCNFIVYLPSVQVIDELGQAKTGMIAYLQEQLASKNEQHAEKAEEQAAEAETDLRKLSKAEKLKKIAAKKERQAKKQNPNVDFTVKLWMDELKLTAAEIDTEEKMKAIIEKLSAPKDEALQEKIKQEKHAVILAVVEELKALGAKVTTEEFKPRIPEADKRE